MSWELFLSTLENLEPLFVFLTSILWAVYIFFTIRTFHAIQKQTELQYQAFLVVAVQPKDELDSGTQIPQEAKDIYAKWCDILNKNVPEAMANANEQYLTLEFTNRGRSDIIDWKIEVEIEIFPESYLQSKCNIIGEKISWSVKYQGYSHNISPDDSIAVPIACLGAFPRANFKWNISYNDARDLKYKKFGGDRDYKDTNVLASPKK